uniref:Uncharacterized protein n=1 Tax=Anopheles epiroticus TaxID=199890 RepID=A0A182P6K9_9DIPT
MTFCRALNWKHGSNYSPKKQTMSTVVPTGLKEVKPEETITIAAETCAEQAKRYEAAEQVLLCAKNDTAPVSSEPVAHSRVLRELNTAATKPVASAVGASGSRPVSVTASIFTSLPSGAASGSEKTRAVNKPTVCGTPQSVTAKLFVTLPPPAGAGIGGGASGVGSKPQHATEKIFAPRTEDMNKGFLMFSEEEPGLTSKYILPRAV